MSHFLIFLGQQWILVSILLVLVFLFIQTEIKRGGETISSHQLTAKVNRENALVVDIRDPAEFKEGHIVDALHIPYSKFKERMPELEKHKANPIIIVDKMGQYSGTVGKQLLDAGYTVFRLDGGMVEWRGSNLPVVRD